MIVDRKKVIEKRDKKYDDFKEQRLDIIKQMIDLVPIEIEKFSKDQLKEMLVFCSDMDSRQRQDYFMHLFDKMNVDEALVEPPVPLQEFEE